MSCSRSCRHTGSCPRERVCLSQQSLGSILLAVAEVACPPLNRHWPRVWAARRGSASSGSWLGSQLCLCGNGCGWKEGEGAGAEEGPGGQQPPRSTLPSAALAAVPEQPSVGVTGVEETRRFFVSRVQKRGADQDRHGSGRWGTPGVPWAPEVWGMWLELACWQGG